MPNEKYILFLDLETTGSDVNNDEIIEVGLVLLDANTFEEIDTFSRVVFPQEKAFERMLNNDIVFNMHQTSGLIYEDALMYRDGNTAEDVDNEIYNWIQSHVPGTDHIPYGGSGVSHFDRKFIDKFLPRLSKRITYWAYDVGSVRRVAMKAGLGWPSQDAKNHRALVDARFHAEEFRYAVRAFSGSASSLISGRRR